MSVMGKILVVLNLVFALAVGGFFLIDFAKRRDWHEAHQKRVEQLKVQAAAVQTFRETLKQRSKEVDDLKIKLKNEKQRNEDRILKLEMEIVKQNDQASRHKANYEKLQLNFEEITKQKDLLVEELKQRNQVIAEREKEIAALQKQRQSLELAYQNQKRIADSFKFRNVSLLESNLELSREIAKLKAQAGTGVVQTTAQGDVTKPRRPGINIKGAVEKVDAEDKTLVQINKGSDQGVAKNHLLEVYRLSPKAEYLGQLVILEVYHGSAVGRLVRNEYSSSRSQLKVGDIVASSLQQ